MINEYWPKDNKGDLKDLASWANVDPIYTKVIEDVKNSYLKHLEKKEILCIYIIGSITTGKAKFGISDIDSFALLNSKAENASWLSSESKAINNTNPCISKVGLKLIEAEKILNLEEIFKAFLIKTQGLCIYGEDIKNKLPFFKPTYQIALPKVKKFREYLDEAKNAIAASSDTQFIKNWCRKINKVIIRTAALLVIEDTGEYSNDIYTCSKLYNSQHPGFSKEFLESIKLVESPTSNRNKINKQIKIMENILSKEIKSFLLRHN